MRRSSNSPRNLEPLRHLAVDDTLRESLNDCGLADTRFPDQNGVVLGTPLQHLDSAADLVVTADHGIELALFGALRQVDGIFFQRLALLLGAGVIHLLPATHLLDRTFDRTLGGTRLAQ